MKPVTVEIISLVLGLFDTCPSCELVSDQLGLKKKRDDQILNDYPEDLKEDYLFLSHWIRELSQKYREDIRINLIDAQSFQGVLKSIRHGVFRYPTFIIDKKQKYTGKDKERLDALLQEHLRNS
jgi:hypothetical protein